MRLMSPRATRYVARSSAVALAAGLLAVASGTSEAATLPTGFRDDVVISGLLNPVALRFASDGRIFVAQKNGQILVYDSLTDTSPTIFADLRTQVQDFWDRGLLGLALDPQFTTTRPYVYVLYTY